MTNIRTVVVDSFEKWRNLRPQWQALLDQSPSSCFFLTWEWLIAWGMCCLETNRSLFILLCYEKDELIGIAPFYLEKKKIGPLPHNELRFLGTPESGSDYLDVISLKRREKKVAEAVYKYLTDDASRKWDQLVLTDIRSDSLFLIHFLNFFESDGKYIELTRAASCPYIKLPQSEDEFYETMSPRWRKKFKQNMRVSDRDYLVSHVVHRGHQAARHLDDFFLHYEEKSSWSGKKLHDILMQLVKEYKEEPPVQLDFLLVDGTPRAALLHFYSHQTLYMYLMSVDKKFNPKLSFGNILVGRSIINGIKANYAFYDFLKGAEQYKFHWATEVSTTVCIRFWQKKPAALSVALYGMSRSTYKLLFN